MRKSTVGARLYIEVLAVFTIFAVSFIIFQHAREREYKVGMINLKLQDYNIGLAEALPYIGEPTEETFANYVKSHKVQGIRVTIIRKDGSILYDSMYKDYMQMGNHLKRKEVKEALKHGSGYDINRVSSTLNHTYFYSATYFPEHKLIIRSALPYDNSLSKTLKADQHYMWFALAAMLILIYILYRFMSRLSDNINKLRIFASRADHNESLDTEDLVDFPGDELGEIAERIIKIYKRLQKTKEEQNILKRQLTQNIAHELKTPVASIQGYLETILENPHINEETKEQFLQRCYAQSQRLASLLQDISTLNRIEDASGLMDFEKVNISTMVGNIMKETALQMSERNMVFDNQLPEGIEVNGNQSLLYSVFRNLTDNAIAYAGEGTTVTLSVKDDTDCWHFTFKDNGVGVPHEHLPRLFERFYRVDKGRSRKMGGTGLGLAIVKNAVICHGGSISVRNNASGGLCFEFDIKKGKI